MTILHVGRKVRGRHPSNIHPMKWLQTIDRFWPRAKQRWIHRDAGLVEERPDLVLVHFAEMDRRNIAAARQKWPGVSIAAHVWSHLWFGNPNASKVWDQLQHADLLIGKFPVEEMGHLSKNNAPSLLEMRHLIDEKTFKPGQLNDKTLDVFVARIGRKGAYWPHEVTSAISEFENHLRTDGTMTPEEFAKILRQTRAVVACREDAGPSYTVIEACLCGSIPVVSDVPEIRHEFTGPDGKVIGARLAKKSANSIREAIQEILEMSPEQYLQETARNRKHFRRWTMEFNGPPMIDGLRKIIKVKR